MPDKVEVAFEDKREKGAQKVLLVSACLAGIRCRYDGKSAASPQAIELVRKGLAMPLCPEQLGGLGTPRPPAEIRGGTASDVLDGIARVVGKNGEDLTIAYIRGAFEMLRVCKRYRLEEAILKSRSPSCGCGQVYDGSFSGVLCPGDGVTTALLKRHGIDVSAG